MVGDGGGWLRLIIPVVIGNGLNCADRKAAAVVWCLPILLVAGFVRTPFKSTPGTLFAREVAGDVTGVSFVLFFLGAAWVSWSTESGRSDLLKSSVYFAFAAWVGSILLGPTGS